MLEETPRRDLAQRMASAILAGAGQDQTVIPTLQRAGFTGREIVAGVDEAVRIVDRIRHPNGCKPDAANLLDAVQRVTALQRAGSILQSCDLPSRRTARL